MPAKLELGEWPFAMPVSEVLVMVMPLARRNALTLASVALASVALRANGTARPTGWVVPSSGWPNARAFFRWKLANFAAQLLFAPELATAAAAALGRRDEPRRFVRLVRLAPFNWPLHAGRKLISGRHLVALARLARTIQRNFLRNTLFNAIAIADALELLLVHLGQLAQPPSVVADVWREKRVACCSFAAGRQNGTCCVLLAN